MIVVKMVLNKRLNKKGIELSINFIVMLILAIAVLSFGIVFLSKLGEGGKKMSEQIDEQTAREIEALLDDGSRVAIPFTHQTTKAKKPVFFGIGVLNVLGVHETFSISVAYGPGYKSDKSPICDAVSCQTRIGMLLLPTSAVHSLNHNERAMQRIAITPMPGAEKGTYVFDVQVTYGAGIVYDFKKIYVNVN